MVTDLLKRLRYYTAVVFVGHPEMKKCMQRAFIAIVAAATATSIPAGLHASQPLLERQLRAMYGNDPGEIRYFSGSVDLNFDGTPETIAHVTGTNVCGSGGCPTLVSAEDAGILRLIAKITITRLPRENG